MKLYSSKKSNPRLSLFCKNTTPEKTCKRKLYRNLSKSQNKSRESSNPLKQERSNKAKVQEKEEQLTKLRQEAYADLHAQLQHYNDEFVTRMRYEENLNSLSSTDSSFSESSQDTSIQELVELFETGTVKDYSQLIEWESFKNPPNYFECRGEYGDLW
ncbi:hypothetical protein MFLAVUS_008814 [Mucor flavus]|uniref:Uncharacterized protein n=1 Tax=Mucor flavus TaxID=439312 RepID=A0ABP9Z852_9FUNG